MGVKVPRCGRRGHPGVRPPLVALLCSATGGRGSSDAGKVAPKATSWITVASYATYLEAQAAVDHLEASLFPVQELEIVGSGLRTVERVTGPMSFNRTVLTGAASGAWIGLFVGFLIALFTSGAVWLGLLLGGLCIGAVWGALFALSAHWYTRGHHNFSSLHTILATRYDVIALDALADRARSGLGLS